MSNTRTILKFDGPALDGKSMDVEQLAPSLLSLSELIKDTNKLYNGDRAGVRVFVNADIEQNCFEIAIELANTLWDSAKNLISDDKVVTVKEIAEWIGLISGGSYTLYKLIAHLKGKKIKSVTKLSLKDGKNEIEIEFEGDESPIKVTQQVYGLYSNVLLRQKAVAVLAPLRNDGYDSLEFYEKKDKPVMHIDKSDVPNSDLSDLPEVKPQNEHKSNIRTGVRIRMPAYEGNQKWTIVYKRAIQASINDEAWLSRFQSGKEDAPPGSSLDVDLEERYITNSDGEMVGEPSYRVIKVYSVELPMRQESMKFDESTDNDQP